MNSTSTKVYAAILAPVALVLAWAAGASATTPTPVSLATDAGTSMRDTGISVVAVLIPLAVALLLARKALPWAKKMLHL